MKLTKKDYFKGISFVILEAFFFSLMGFCVKMAGNLPVGQKAFMRNFIAFFIALIMLLKSPQKLKIQKENLKDLIIRSVFGTAGMLANFWALDHLDIADANILNKMAPFFAIIMSIIILKEIPNKIEWISVFLAFTGVLFVVKPSAGVASFPAIIGLLGGFFAGTAYTYVRKLGQNGERGPIIVMFFSLFSTIVCLILTFFEYKPMNLKQILFLIGAGICAAIGQLAITAAYTKVPAKDISVFDYSQVLFATIWGICFLGEIPDNWSIIGYIIIIGTAIWKWYYALKLSKR
ncbi:DMT family transporter [Fusobacterium sp.]|uniref:DMT family transporter n=1 Tax=Fusobacterium sp. TaxID=68766 RepID=UPI00396C75DB